MARLVIVGMMLVMLGACTQQVEDLKSPCVGGEGSPCARRPVNDWWAHV